MRRKTLTARFLILLLITMMAISACNKGESEMPSTEEKTSKKVAQTIAVVNEDAGVEYSTGIINYSEEFIKTLDEEYFQLISSAEAEEGLANGNYAGIFLFPANLSFSILNLNYRNPQRINVKYRISEIADKDTSDEAYDRIIEAYQQFNNRLSYAYINALMEEIELGQYNVAEIFKNNESNIEAAKKLLNGDYNALLEAPHMPEKQVEFSEQDTSEYQRTGITYANELSKLYENAYKSAYDKAIKEYGTAPTAQEINDAINDIIGLLDAIETHRSALYGDDDESFTSQYTNYENCVNDFVGAVETYKEATQKYLNNEISQEEYEGALESLNTKQDNLQTAPGLPQESDLPAKDRISGSGNSLRNKVSEKDQILNKMAESLKPENMIKVAMEDPDSEQTYGSKIAEKKNEFEKSTSNTTNRFNSIQKDNLKELNDAYKDNSEFTFKTVENVNEKVTKDQEAIEKSVKAFMRTAEGNSADTKKRLSSFEGMLSGAKVDGRVSSEVMKFLIQPIQLVEEDTPYN